MCGIFGAIEWEQSLDVQRLIRATDSLRHRGPDESGFFFDNVPSIPVPGRVCSFQARRDGASWQVGLGQRRLSIVDLTTGQQPMSDSTGRWTINYNGEVYNSMELREQLASEGAIFRTDHSDTETVLLGFARWGPAMLPKLNGMFAAAIYDREQGRFWLIRDRFGKKPLYLLHGDGRLVFGSELKALVEYLGASPRLDWDALGDYMMRACIHEPRSIFRGIVKVPAATCTEFDLRPKGGRLLSQKRYWEFLPKGAPEKKSEQDWLAELEHLLDDAVKIRLLADVPVGAFLSSGIDSATVCALASKHVTEPLRAFTISTDDRATDESSDAAQVAARLGLKHVSERCRLDPQTLLSEMVTTFDEPFSDLSMAPTLHVSRLAAREVKVVVTGDGADEFFAGYNIFATMTMRSRLEWVPGLGSLARGFLNHQPLAGRGGGFLARNFPPKGFARYRAQVESPKMLTLLDREVAERIRPEWPRLNDLWDRAQAFDNLNQVSFLQGMTYLTDDILVKVDRATMAHSLEARAPFLDFRVVEFASCLPPNLKFADGRGKIILRRLLRKWFPDEYINKPKRGFIVPLKDWLRTEMRDELHDLSRCELLSGPQVSKLVALHLSGSRDVSPALWRLLVLNRWLKQWRPTDLNGSLPSGTTDGALRDLSQSPVLAGSPVS